MKTIQELIAALRTGQQPVVTFLKGVEDKESYAETGMRARALRVNNADREVASIVFGFAEFDELNRPFESSNYYDKNSVPRLTAREAGFYKAEDALYFGCDENLEQVFTVDSGSTSALFFEFGASASNQSYVQWLEAQMVAARESRKAEPAQAGVQEDIGATLSALAAELTVQAAGPGLTAVVHIEASAVVSLSYDCGALVSPERLKQALFENMLELLALDDSCIDSVSLIETRIE